MPRRRAEGGRAARLDRRGCSQEGLPQAELKSYKGGGPLLLDAVMQGQADFGVNDASAVVGGLANYPPNSMRILPDSMLSKEPLAFAVRYDSQDLLELVKPVLPQCRTRRPAGAESELLGQYLDWKKDH